MIIPNKIYDVLKWILCIVVPATETLIVGLGKLYNFDTAIIVGTIAIVSTFLGAVLGISCSNYSRAEQDGEE